MTIPLIILCLTVLIFIFLLRMISQYKISNLNFLSNEQQKIQSKYDFMVKHRKELKAELEEKIQRLTRLRNNQEGVKIISSDDLNIEDVDDTEKISRYLLQNSKITLEQNERALKKMEILKMDFLAVCLALGFVDMETSKQALKANNIQLKSSYKK
ncbi:hypothetical protein SYK_08890 [Pseudodesulfovibrio nedwellii]|uniref:DUF2802 domain-containing protein n=2 Tax=Pseudodesulfovibrio nedwellii TaxID=2973072 RepID=A0ABN6RZX5_9BACT|nr:hypothetical protein SYK_08890 [Pseudodesulfovibrio nedwellii]